MVADQMPESGKPKMGKKKLQRKPAQEEEGDDVCYCCNEGGSLVLCDVKKCSRVYHLECLNHSALPKGKSFNFFIHYIVT